MQLWNPILSEIENGNPIVLLYVINSEGSSPGRQGFGMGVSEKGMWGSIGGGAMEQKLVELAKSKLKNPPPPFCMKQIHRKDADTDQSGMICSGEQTIAFYFLDSKDLSWIKNLVKCLLEEGQGILFLNQSGIEFMQSGMMKSQYTSEITSETEWSFREQIGHRNTMYVVGGGHVGLALSETMRRLGFFVVQLDNREELNTMVNNPHAHKKEVINYDEIEKFIEEGEQSYIALVSFGYRTDKLILKQILRKNYKYVGMMGSTEKVRQLYEELEKEGFEKSLLDRLHAPIGITTHCKTPQEIAVSIAADIIQVKNFK